MKVRLTLVAAALTALVAAGCGSSNSSSSSSAAATLERRRLGGVDGLERPRAARRRSRIEAPFTGPVAQVGLEQLHFAQLAVADDNKANGTNVTLVQDDTQLTPVAGDHRRPRRSSVVQRGRRRSAPRAARRSRP